jgi:hypothetical protein
MSFHAGRDAYPYTEIKFELITFAFENPKYAHGDLEMIEFGNGGWPKAASSGSSKSPNSAISLQESSNHEYIKLSRKSFLRSQTQNKDHLTLPFYVVKVWSNYCFAQQHLDTSSDKETTKTAASEHWQHCQG